MNIQEKLVAALQAQGERVVESRTSKYIVLTRSTNNVKFYYVGKNGALRSGNTISESVSVPNTAKRLLAQ